MKIEVTEEMRERVLAFREAQARLREAPRMSTEEKNCIYAVQGRAITIAGIVAEAVEAQEGETRCAE